MAEKSRVRLVVVTDLDACLLDHETYSFDAARSVLSNLDRLGHYLVLNSSKTISEMRYLAEEITGCNALVAENGSVIAYPGEGREFDDLEQLGQPFDVIQLEAKLKDLRLNQNLQFKTHLELGAKGFAEATGLEHESAKRAVDRKGTVSLYAEGGDKDAICHALNVELDVMGFKATPGGRMISVAPIGTDKAVGLEVVRDGIKADHSNERIVVVAVGDSLNDFAMLVAADIRVAIRNPDHGDTLGRTLLDEGYSVISHSSLTGPKAWAQSVQRIIQQAEICSLSFTRAESVKHLSYGSDLMVPRVQAR